MSHVDVSRDGQSQHEGSGDEPWQWYPRLRREVAEFAASVVAPRVAAMEESRSVDVEVTRLIVKQGWLGVTISDKYGGLALGHVAKLVILEELSAVSAAMGAMLQASQLGTAKIIHLGTESQKAQWLPGIAAGDVLPTIATTERESGSHVLGMSMSAKRAGKSYVLNGRKVFVGNSHVGDLHGVVARTGEGSRGLTAFLVESDRPGLSLAPQQRAMGLHGFSFGELIFDNCRIPAANRIGTDGEGLDTAYSSSIVYGRQNLTGVALGIHRAAVDAAFAYATSRRLYGSRLCDLANITQDLGDMRSRYLTARSLAYGAARALDAGRACDEQLINAKLVNADAAVQSAMQALTVHGAAGLMSDRPVERYLRDALHILFPAGTPEVQKLLLARGGIGGSDHSDWSQRFAGT